MIDQSRLKGREIRVSVPCRIDFGGTLDIATFYLSMARLKPATLNIALDMRTHVTLRPWEKGRIKISSAGFETLETSVDQMSYAHPLGLISAIARYFNAQGVHVDILSTSPPRSALGGSSSAAVAVIAAFVLAQGKEIDPEQVCWLAHHIESSVAGVICGVQDQTAAAFGGVNLWEWSFGRTGPVFRQNPLFESQAEIEALNQNILVAYCGIPHVSKDVNKEWVEGFVKGTFRKPFEKILGLTRSFYQALKSKDHGLAADLMNQETAIRCEITPQVLDKTGKKLFERAKELGCGARFTGAGGGGCLWAVGEAAKISGLAPAWKEILDAVKGGSLLSARIDTRGIVSDNQSS